VQKKSLEPRLAEAQAGQRAVFFVDAAHLVFAPFLGVLWCVQRLFVKAPSGRQRFTVWAALHATAHELFTVPNLTAITATTVWELLHGLAGAYPINTKLGSKCQCWLKKIDLRPQAIAQTLGTRATFPDRFPH
jgi:hypothetical protein